MGTMGRGGERGPHQPLPHAAGVRSGTRPLPTQATGPPWLLEMVPACERRVMADRTGRRDCLCEPSWPCWHVGQPTPAAATALLPPLIR